MNRSPVLLLLVCAQVLMAVMVAVLFWLQFTAARELGNQNAVIARLQYFDQATRQLLVDTIEFSKRNPSIDPILVVIGAKNPRVPPTNAPLPGTAPLNRATPAKP